MLSRKNQIEGTPILKLEMGKRLCVIKSYWKIKIRQKNSSTNSLINSSKKIVKKFIKKICQKIRILVNQISKEFLLPSDEHWTYFMFRSQVPAIEATQFPLVCKGYLMKYLLLTNWYEYFPEYILKTVNLQEINFIKEIHKAISRTDYHIYP